MQISHEMNRVLVAVLIGFGLVALAAAYWAAFGPDTILKREDNPRLVEAEAAILRGDIVDRRGNLLVSSTAGNNRVTTREYLYPAAASVLGYYSLRYGVGGAEAAYDDLLRGENLVKSVINSIFDQLLHRPQQGSDIRLTLDLNVQQRVVEAMKDRAGAVVVLAVPGGEVLAMVSLPSFDPNTLDASWETLSAAPGKPFFNRALQGSYQAGGTLQTPLMAAALLENRSLEAIIPNATTPVTVDDVTLTCAVRLPFDELTLRDAYAFACPQPFALLARELGAQRIQDAFDTFHFDEPPTLPGFVTVEGDRSRSSSITVTEATLIESALGQGSLTVTPLEMAMMAAAIINDGNAPQPYTLMATRLPGAVDWIPPRTVHPTRPYATANTARRLQDLMRNAVRNGAALNAARPNIDIGGHAALAYSGNESQAWFVGFATIGGRQAVAAAVVIENSADPGLAADIGGTALAAAHEAFQLPSS